MSDTCPRSGSLNLSGTVVFDLVEVRPLVEHALAAREHLPICGEEKDPDPGPALLFVHDYGVYVMSNGNPRQLVGKKGSQRSRVAYADGCDPSKNAHWWEASSSLVGGDDFVKKIPIYADLRRWILDTNNDKLIIEIDGQSMVIKVSRWV